MAEIRPDQYQNGDKQKDIEIERDVKLYTTKSYEIAVFLFNRMFKTFNTANGHMIYKMLTNFLFVVSY
jgi:hypothetical protein